ncbi:NAD(P)/FAD-dependent oxidoreductase [Winogradskyella sp. A3E31]|uniref:NAD(P)/FAD-dependent oxidoreductase n=1 Tax=Winogradskyella sp. A3E31 TaxID=3349637 RepID=UPI00398B0ECB
MISYDYIMVGCGLAGIAFIEKLKANNKSFLVFDDASQKSSVVAAGLYNPVALKRFNKVWKSTEQLDLALPMYAKIESDLNIQIDYKLKILRRFSSTEEQNLWYEASGKPGLKEYMSSDIVRYKSPNIKSEHHFGEVLQAGRIDTETLIKAYRKELLANNQLKPEKFKYEEIEISGDSVKYQDVNTKNMVFAEGFGVKQNPFFRKVELNGTKGELITIKAPKLNIDFAIKSSVFVIPLGNDLYKVGSTYNRVDKTNTTTEAAKNELITKLKSFMTCDFEVVEHSAGVRPTTKDRRPLVGSHHSLDNVYILNGLGTRGVMIAPYVAEKLYKLIEYSEDLDPEIDVNRFS